MLYTRAHATIPVVVRPVLHMYYGTDYVRVLPRAPRPIWQLNAKTLKSSAVKLLMIRRSR